ncbi:1-phosphofructokinase [Acidocella facilis]|uniref:1-phosphofructokinase n=1 Tax=Acidocella facilis TaxID=525 RepID=UPI00047E6967|nr:1-phosphofructokinase [Acidocella facilis]
MSAPVLTVTLNPALDQTVLLDGLHPGQVHRASAAFVHAGGKGVNVAACLADWGGGPVAASGLLGADNQAAFTALFAAKGIEDGFLRLPGETRTNIKLSHDGDTTDINLPGLIVPAGMEAALADRLEGLAVPGGVVLLAGSLPAGIAPGFYASLIARLAARGVRVLLDSSGAPLKAGLGSAVKPFAIKPNRAELEELAGRVLPDDAALLAAAGELNAGGVELVVVSLGAEGAVFVTARQAVHAGLPPLRVVSSVGAGDAMMAGIIAALRDGAGLERIARLGTAFAAGKLGRAGANLPPREEIEALANQVVVKNLTKMEAEGMSV